MADRTVRAIFEARVSGAQKGMRDFAKDVDGAGKKVDTLTKDLKTLSNAKVSPTIDVKIADARKRLSDLTLQLADLKKMDATPEVEADIKKAQDSIREVRAEIKDLNGQKAEVKVDASIKDAQKRLSEITLELGNLRTLEATPEVDADIKAAQRRMREVRAELRELNAARAEMRVTADTSAARSDIADLSDDIEDAGADSGRESGLAMIKGILAGLAAIPIVGAVIGVGQAIGEGIIQGLVDSLAIDAERDLFSAQTGLDEDTSARFGRAAGEAYANAWGDSVAANLDTAKMALRAGIIDSEATDAEIENVIAKLQGLNDLFEYDIAESVRGVGNLMKSGLVKDADQAFDLIVKASQKVQSDDLIDTLNEYSTQFKTLGLDGPKAFGLISQGAAAGARDTDIVADALKEMGIRIREGTEPATDALKLLGLNAGDTVKAFQEGGPRAASAIDEVFDALRALQAKGGNTQEVIAALFGGPGEDLGAALYALDIDEAAAALDGLDGAAGAADRALQTMGDNTATKMEAAKRDVELAMDGIKGALAEAFGDEIDGAATWVSKNRAPLMQFFLDVINGTIDMGIAFANFSATGLETIGELADGLADFLDSIPFVDDALGESLRGVAASSRGAADEIRTEIPAALEEVRDKANAWAAPEILKARVHDATVAMTEDMDEFVEKVGTSDLKVEINGETLNAEEALAELVENINGEDGTVTIDGDRVPADKALARLMEKIDNSAESVTVGADTDPAERALDSLRRRYATMNIRVAGVTGVGGLTSGTHDGGWTGRVAPGLHSGGRVPGIDPGYDNVLWPLNSGGRTLAQPLAGGEYVVNSKDSAYWAPILEWMNNGGRPTQRTEDNSMSVSVGTIVTPDVDSFRRRAERERAAAYAANRSAS